MTRGGGGQPGPGHWAYLALVGVGVFAHDALVVLDVLKGLARETPAGSRQVQTLLESKDHPTCFSGTETPAEA